MLGSGMKRSKDKESWCICKQAKKLVPNDRIQGTLQTDIEVVRGNTIKWESHIIGEVQIWKMQVQNDKSVKNEQNTAK